MQMMLLMRGGGVATATQYLVATLNPGAMRPSTRHDFDDPYLCIKVSNHY